MLGNLDENGKMILRSSAVIVAGQSNLLESVRYYYSVVRYSNQNVNMFIRGIRGCLRDFQSN